MKNTYNRDKELNKVQDIAGKLKDEKLLKDLKKRKENSNICKDGKDEHKKIQ
ncbi:hypothetical protein [Epilithonimonas caeni]|uniref:hypothetical protein n=1 Tax=Epilithonimonas caeni TaxID=365343 RepID=UPI0003FA9ED5|nr:hypothetical protein [Epilithonimonas caeni]